MNQPPLPDRNLNLPQPPSPDWAARAEPYRRELLVHCYRMLGSFEDAEDLVQETMLRAWRRADTYKGRAPFRAWLYKIATNACLDALQHRPRRTLPLLSQTGPTFAELPSQPVLEPIWLEPFPDELWADVTTDPEAHYNARESITLAFVAALQVLPPRQRAVLLLRDVLDWKAREVAALLHLTVPSVNSALYRARVTMARNYSASNLGSLSPSPSDEMTRQLLDRYVEAWQTGDVPGLVSLLKEDATLSMPPSPSWYRGRDSIARVMGGMAFGGDATGRWRLLPTRANAQPAFGLYIRLGTGQPYQAYGIQVIRAEGGYIADMVTFLNGELLTKFGLPSEVKM